MEPLLNPWDIFIPKINPGHKIFRTRSNQYRTMPNSIIMKTPLRLSPASILPAALSLHFSGKMLKTAIPNIPIKTGSAKACASNANLKWPFNSRTTAVVSPHPGHVTPNVERIGHCQPAVRRSPAPAGRHRPLQKSRDTFCPAAWGPSPA